MNSRRNFLKMSAAATSAPLLSGLAKAQSTPGAAVAGKAPPSDPDSWQLDPTLGAPVIPADWWSVWPYSKWTFSHVSESTRTATVWRGPGPVLPLPQRLRNMAGLEIAFGGGRRATLREFLEKDYTDGFLILHRGEIVFETYMNGMEPHFKHIGRSVTKCVTGTMVGILVGKGLIDPESLVTRYLPEVQATAYRGATVQQLLDMTAGATVRGENELYVPHTDMYNYLIASGYIGSEGHPEAPADVWQAILRITEQNAPHGARYEYHDAHIDLLGFIMQRVSGKFLPELFSSELWGPMGAEEDACQMVDKSRFALSSGGFQATLRDWARFALLHLRRGKLNGRQIVPSKWIDDTRAANDHLFQLQLHTEDPDSVTRAYHNGCRIYDRKRRDYGHTGSYGQFLYMDPQSDFAAVKLSHWPDAAEVQLLQRPDRQVTKPLFGSYRDTFAAIRAIRDELAK